MDEAGDIFISVPATSTTKTGDKFNVSFSTTIDLINPTFIDSPLTITSDTFIFTLG
jgi:hypothetical protein